jgi:hypothetical protein
MWYKRHYLVPLHGVSTAVLPLLKFQPLNYEGESINRSQMDIKCKTCDISTWEKHLFLDISSTNVATVVPSLCQCIKTCSINVFWRLSQQLLHFLFSLFVINETFAIKVVLSLFTWAVWDLALLSQLPRKFPWIASWTFTVWCRIHIFTTLLKMG